MYQKRKVWSLLGLKLVAWKNKWKKYFKAQSK